jgi:hypothetical protein
MPNEGEEMVVQYINEAEPRRCPPVDMYFGQKKVSALLDSGSQVTLVADELYKELIASGYPTLHVPMQSAVLIMPSDR